MGNVRQAGVPVLLLPLLTAFCHGRCTNRGVYSCFAVIYSCFTGCTLVVQDLPLFSGDCERRADGNPFGVL